MSEVKKLEKVISKKAKEIASLKEELKREHKALHDFDIEYKKLKLENERQHERIQELLDEQKSMGKKILQLETKLMKYENEEEAIWEAQQQGTINGEAPLKNEHQIT